MAEPLSVNAADPREVALADEQRRQRAQQAADDLRDELSSEAGRRRIWQRLERYGLYREITGDLETVYRALGRRSLGLQLFAEVLQSPEFYLLMVREAINRARLEDERLAALRAQLDASREDREPQGDER